MQVCQYLGCFWFTKQLCSNAQDKIHLDSNPHRISVIFSLRTWVHSLANICDLKFRYMESNIITYEYFPMTHIFWKWISWKELKCHERGKTCIDSHSQDRLPKRSNGLYLTIIRAKVICGSVWDGRDGGSGKDKVINHAKCVYTLHFITKLTLLHIIT